jgi:hypothetical protein
MLPAPHNFIPQNNPRIRRVRINVITWRELVIIFGLGLITGLLINREFKNIDNDDHINSNFPSECQLACTDCNYNNCWDKCACDSCDKCLYTFSGVNLVKVAETVFPPLCKKQCQYCNFNKCWDRCFCAECAICLYNIYPDMDFYK